MSEPKLNKPAPNWKTLLICPDSKMSTHILSLISQQVALGPIFELPTYPYRTVLTETLAGKTPHMCFVDASSDPERALATIRNLTELHPGIQIIVLLNANEPDLILRCLRQGATEFLVEPFTPEQLRQALEKLMRMRPNSGGARQGMGKVFCVAPAKGACGASTVAAHLAMQFRRMGQKKLLLADLDPLTGTLAFILKLKSPYSFLDAIHRASTLDEGVWKALVVNIGGVDVLLSPENPADGIQEVQDPSAIIEVSRELYDYVVLDSAGVYGDWHLALMQLCDEILMVTTNELPALQAAQRGLSYLEHHQVPRAKVKLIVNRYAKDVGLSRELIETALHMEVFQALPSDYENIQKAVIEGKPAPPNSAFGKAIAALAEQLLPGAAAAPEPAKKSASFLKVFDSLFARRPTT